LAFLVQALCLPEQKHLTRPVLFQCRRAFQGLAYLAGAAQETPEILAERVTPVAAVAAVAAAIRILTARASVTYLALGVTAALALVVVGVVAVLVLLALLALLATQEPQEIREAQAPHQQGLDRLYRGVLQEMPELVAMVEPEGAVAVAGQIPFVIRLFHPV
jgi:hypothetical protein